MERLQYHGPDLLDSSCLLPNLGDPLMLLLRRATRPGVLFYIRTIRRTDVAV
jgi:hypothetical protein